MATEEFGFGSKFVPKPSDFQSLQSMNWESKTSLEAGLAATYEYFSKLTLAVCLPVTSRGCISLGDVKERLRKLVLDISSQVFVGIDDDDYFYNLPEVNESWFEQILERPCHIHRFTRKEKS